MKKSLLALMLAASLIGCAPVPIIKYKYLSEPVPAALTQDCTVTAPPAKEQYTSSTWEQKEALLSKSLQGTYKDLAQCNRDKAALRAWQTQQDQLRTERQGQ